MGRMTVEGYGLSEERWRGRRWREQTLRVDVLMEPLSRVLGIGIAGTDPMFAEMAGECCAPFDMRPRGQVERSLPKIAGPTSGRVVLL
jgi:hypothetical protein